jgi:SAM-dependent methyltransferase
VVVSNLWLHNIYDKAMRQRALGQIVRVLRPGGVAIISDYKRTGEYAEVFSSKGLTVEKKRRGFFTTFPPLTIVVARKPL